MKRALFATMMIAIGIEFVLLFASYPIGLALPLLVILFLILLVNNQLYIFFIRKRGFVFALAALPLQLIYYLYSVIAFVIGGGIHFWNTSFKPK